VILTTLGFSFVVREGSLQVCQMQEKCLAEQLMQVPGDEWGDLLYIIHPTIGVSAVSSNI